jgi:hypothetical protein
MSVSQVYSRPKIGIRPAIETYKFQPVDTALWEQAYDRYAKLRVNR